MSKKHKSHGFTIVELLIVIVVVGVLAAIVVVVYNGVRERAQYSKMRSDFAVLKKALEMYKSDNGEYPKADVTRCVNNGDYAFERNWCGWGQSANDSFIPGLAPNYIARTPTLDSSIVNNKDSYIYRSSPTPDGLNSGSSVPHLYYQLVRFKDTGLTSVEKTNNPDLYIASGGNGYTGNEAWGIKSDPNMNNW